MALSKKRKQELVSQYETWIKEGRALVLAEYSGLDMPAVDKLRQELRETGGEFHIIKNTLAKLAFEAAGVEVPQEYFLGTTALGIAFEDPPGLAKAIVDFGKETEMVQVKGGYLGGDHMSAEQIIALAELPPLPVVRGQLLSLMMAPAAKLSRLLAEPGRQVAQVLRAHADQGASPAAA